jgi:hypothetical protein
MKTITAAAALVLLAGTATAAPKPRVQTVTPFSLGLAVGEEETLGTAGSLSAVARCVSDDDPVHGTLKRAQLWMVGTVDGWATTWAGTDLAADAEVLIVQTSGGPDQVLLEVIGRIGQSALAPDAWLSLPSDTSAVGLNLFGHDCVFAGLVLKAIGNPAP